MPPHSLTVRPALESDLPGLLVLHAEMRKNLGRRVPRGAEAHRSSPESLFRSVIADPNARLLVAVDVSNGDQVVGMAHLHSQQPVMLLETHVVHAALLHVLHGARTRGVGKALMVAVATYGDELGADHVSVDIYPQHRESQRFYVRLGFAPLVVRRVVPLAVLRRRLGLSAGRGPGEGTTVAQRGMQVRRATARRVSGDRRRAG